MDNYYEQYLKQFDPEELKKALAPYAPSSFDVNVSDTTVPMQGVPESLPSQSGGIPVIPEIPQAPVAPPAQPVLPSPTKSAVNPALNAAKTTPNAMTSGPNPLDVLTQPKSTDQEARNRMDKDEKTRHLLGTIPVALGGVADAIGNAATVFGGKGTSGAGERVAATLEKGEKERGVKFEEDLKNDPKSQISGHYRDVLAMMMGTKADDPKIKNLSASQIASTLPEVEKYMAKELQLKSIEAGREATKTAKDLALSEKEDQFNQRRWERFGSAVNPLTAGSRKALGIAASNNMRADRLLVTAQRKEITSQDYSNLIADLQGIYKGGVPDEVMLKHGDYPSIQRKAGEILSRITGKPETINTPEIKQYLVDLTKDIKSIDNKVIDDNLGFNAVIFDELKESDPDKFQRAMAALEQTTEGVTETPSGKTAPVATNLSAKDQEAIAWAKANPNDPRAAKILKIHGM